MGRIAIVVVGVGAKIQTVVPSPTIFDHRTASVAGTGNVVVAVEIGCPEVGGGV